LGLTDIASATQLIPALGTSAPSSHFFDEMQEMQLGLLHMQLGLLHMQLGLLHMQLGVLYDEALVGFEDPNSAASDRTWDK
jgi:hypothetical protein